MNNQNDVYKLANGVEVLASEKNNREQRCAKKAEREQAEGKKRAKRREKSRREEG